MTIVIFLIRELVYTETIEKGTSAPSKLCAALEYGGQMTKILGRLAIYFFCLLIQLQSFPIDTVLIVTVLLAFILGFAELIIDPSEAMTASKRIVIEVFFSIVLVCALFFPQTAIFAPLLAFPVLRYKMYIAGTLLLGTFASALLHLASPLPLLVGLLFGICMYVWFLEAGQEQLAYKLKKMRDTSKEHELLLEERNKTLRDNQDAEVYTATLKERNRIAREIHDNVGHMLTRSIVQTGALKALNKDELLKGPLNDLHETLNTAMTSIRSSVHDLHDESIDLHSAIREMTDAINQFEVNVDYDMSKHVHKDIKYCFISVVKEALNNALKHSNATKMDILLREHPGFYQLQISDNGTNITLSDAPSGIGLTNMKERVNALKGNLKITTENGFQILISVIKNGENE